MVKNHIKRINAPKRWDILRKDNKFISRPNPGRKLELAVSLNTALKEMLGKTKTTKESKYLIKHKQVLVNGVRRYDEKFGVGFLDVVSLPEVDEHYRLVVTAQDKLAFVKISSQESKLKASKVSNKTLVPGGKAQVNCSDGRNFLMDGKESQKVSTNDTLVYTMPEQDVKETIKLEKGALVFLYQGKHIGKLVHVEEFKSGNIMFKEDGETVETKQAYAFAVGKEKPVITISADTASAKKASGSKKAKKE